MQWFNYYGLLFMAVIMIPNIVYAVKHPAQLYRNKALEGVEQIGRYGAMILMIFNIPYTYWGFWFSCGHIVYIATNSALVLFYCAAWCILWKRNDMVRALTLSVLPTVLFVFCGIMLVSIPLLVCSVLFGIAHIWISCKSVSIDAVNHP